MSERNIAVKGEERGHGTLSFISEPFNITILNKYGQFGLALEKMDTQYSCRVVSGQHVKDR
ncbi:MAG: hypothetical protein KAH23_08810 [Kiritimatiellae bacterium]|nr:hypothetical protein [Kiritimatiellia bacterium]